MTALCACQPALPPDLSGAGKREIIEALYADYRAAFPDVPAVTAEALLADRGSVVLVDVRSPEEQAVSMIPGAITEDAFGRDRERYAGRRVVTYCTIGHRSGVMAQRLRAEGIDAWNLEGSLLAWAHAGGTFERAGTPTRRAHVYGEQWNLLPADFEPVW